MRLLHAFSTFAIGGSQMRFARLANALGPEYQHEVVAMDAATNGFPAAGLVDANVGFATRDIAVRKSRGFSLLNLRTFRQSLDASRPDLLLTYNFGAIEWSLANRLGRWIPHVHFEDGFGPDENASRQLPRRIAARRIAIGARSRIVTPAKGLADLIVERWGFARAQVSLLPNGVDVEAFAAPPDRRELRRNPDDIIVGTIGALRPEKNYGRLIAAVAAMQDAIPVRLIIVGDGPEAASLKAAARMAGAADCVEFVGARTDTAAFYAGFDIFALSSDTEQMPLSVLEAMAAGRPILSTDVGDVRAMTDPANGPFITPLGDEEAYAGALRRLALDDDLRLRIGAANRAKARADFSADAMIAQYDRLFRELAAGGQASAGA